MPLSDSDLKWYRSSTGSSEGGAKSVTLITSGVHDNVFPDLTALELTAGGTRWRKVFLANNSGGDYFIEPVGWVSVAPINITERIGLGFDDADDDDPLGGVLAQWTANDSLEVTSSGSDTRALTVVGLGTTGDPQSESMTLDGTTPVESSETWSKIWAIHADAPSGSRTVTCKQGPAGTTRGILAPNFVNLWVWVTTTAKATGIKLQDLGPGEVVGVWYEQTWIAGAGGVRPNPNRIRFEEV